jgi:hypothetical protein
LIDLLKSSVQPPHNLAFRRKHVPDLGVQKPPSSIWKSQNLSKKSNFFQGDRLQRTLHENQDLPKSLVAFCNHFFIPGKGSTCSQTNIPDFVVAGTNALSNPST